MVTEVPADLSWESRSVAFVQPVLVVGHESSVGEDEYVRVGVDPAKMFGRKAMRQSMVIAGVVIAIIGVIVMGVASNRKEDAQAVSRFSVALGTGASDSAVQSAVTLGFFGLGVLIAGGALAVTGLVVIAARQVTLSQNAEAEA